MTAYLKRCPCCKCQTHSSLHLFYRAAQRRPYEPRHRPHCRPLRCRHGQLHRSGPPTEDERPADGQGEGVWRPLQGRHHRKGVWREGQVRDQRHRPFHGLAEEDGQPGDSEHLPAERRRPHRHPRLLQVTVESTWRCISGVFSFSCANTKLLSDLHLLHVRSVDEQQSGSVEVGGF